MSSLADLAPAVDICRAAGAPVALFQCSTYYPCPPEKAGLNVLAELRERFLCPVGLSDHSGQIYAGLAATTLGASLIETHVTFSRQMFGPDAPTLLIFQKCVVARHALPAGTVLGTADLALKKAGGGLSPAWLERVLGRKLTRALTADEPVQEADLSA
jgi:N,N'-diacetyllegionaminate synthase